MGLEKKKRKKKIWNFLLPSIQCHATSNEKKTNTCLVKPITFHLHRWNLLAPSDVYFCSIKVNTGKTNTIQGLARSLPWQVCITFDVYALTCKHLPSNAELFILPFLSTFSSSSPASPALLTSTSLWSHLLYSNFLPVTHLILMNPTMSIKGTWTSFNWSSKQKKWSTQQTPPGPQH